MVPTADNFEEIELAAVIDILRRAKIKVDLVSMTKSRYITGQHGLTMLSDKIFPETFIQDYDLIAIVGGFGNSTSLSQNKQLIRRIKREKSLGKYIAAICASPSIVFNKKGILDDIDEATCYPLLWDSLKNKQKK